MCPFRQETHSLSVFIFQNHSSGGDPSIAQLVERRTVESVKSSLGRWFESGSKDIFYGTFFSLKKKIQAYVLLVNSYYYLGNRTLHVCSNKRKRELAERRANERTSERAYERTSGERTSTNLVIYKLHDSDVRSWIKFLPAS